MEFGKLPIERLTPFRNHAPPEFKSAFQPVDFSLAPTVLDHPATLHHRSLKIQIGMPVWSVKGWEGRVFPPGTPVHEYLKHYAQRYSTIELNSTHYGVPTADRIRGWCEMTPPHFRFIPKVLKDISHRSLDTTSLAFEGFLRAMEPFGSRLGGFLFQLPDSFEPHRWPELRRFASRWRRTAAQPPIFLELRASGFFHNRQIQQEIADELSLCGWSTTITDVSGRRDVSHGTILNHRVMVRFVLNDGHPSDEERFALWSDKILEWEARGVEKLSLIFHQPGDIRAPESVDHFLSVFKSRLKIDDQDLEKRFALHIGAPPQARQLSLL